MKVVEDLAIGAGVTALVLMIGFGMLRSDIRRILEDLRRRAD